MMTRCAKVGVFALAGLAVLSAQSWSAGDGGSKPKRLGERIRELEERVEELERATSKVSAVAEGGVLRVRRLLLEDGSGKVRGGFGILEDGSVVLNMNDAAGESRAAFGLLEDGSAVLNMRDLGGRPRFGLTVTSRGTVALMLMDKDGRSRGSWIVNKAGVASVRSGLLIATDDLSEGGAEATLAVGDDGDILLSMANENGVMQYVVAVRKNGAVFNWLTDSEGVQRIASNVKVGGAAGIQLNGPDREARVLLSVESDGRGWLDVQDAAGTTRELGRETLDLIAEIRERDVQRRAKVDQTVARLVNKVYRISGERREGGLPPGVRDEIEAAIRTVFAHGLVEVNGPFLHNLAGLFGLVSLEDIEKLSVAGYRARSSDSPAGRKARAELARERADRNED